MDILTDQPKHQLVGYYVANSAVIGGFPIGTPVVMLEIERDSKSGWFFKNIGLNGEPLLISVVAEHYILSDLFS